MKGKVVITGVKKILVVEDDEDILELYKYIFTEEGYEVTTSATGKNLWAIIDTFCPALVVLDVNLGELNGAELCRELKADPATNRIVVLLVSANLNFSDLIYKAGADGVISKPFDLDDLLRRTAAYFPAQN